MFSSFSSLSSLDRYVLRTRKSGRMDIIHDSILVRVRKKIERPIRTLLYGLLRWLISNQPFEGKLEIGTLQSLLVIPMGDAIGDLIFTTPIFRAIKRRNPGCKIGVFISERNESLLQGDPDVDVLYRFAHRRDFRNFSELKRAKKDRYQIILNLHITNISDYGFFSHYIGRRAIKILGDHPRRDKYRLFFNYIGRRPRNSIHLSIQGLDLLSEVVEFEPPLQLWETWPQVTVPSDVAMRIREAVQAKLHPGTRGYIIIHLQAGTKFREWGATNALSLARMLREQYPDYTIFLTSAPNSFSLSSNDLPKADSGIQFYATSRDLRELAALIQGAALIITPETSITHFASATKTPAVVLMSNRDRIPFEWLPISNPARILAPERGGDPVETIPVLNVLEAAASLLEERWSHTQSSLELQSREEVLQHASGQRLLRDLAPKSLFIPTL